MKIELSQILKIVAEYYGISLNLIKAENRRKDIAKAKHVYFYLANVLTKEKLVAIGLEVNKHHTTVIHGINKISTEKEIYKDIYDEIEELKNMITPKNKLIVENIDLLYLCQNYSKSFINP